MNQREDTILGAMDELAPDEIARSYDNFAPRYEQLVSEAGYVLPKVMAERFREVANAQNMSLDDSIVDAGCGSGLAGVALRDVGFTNVYGLDLSPGLIAQIPPGVYRPFRDEGVIEASLTNLPEHYCGKFGHVFSAGTIGHTATLDLAGIVQLGRQGGLVAFSVREHQLVRYDDVLAALRALGIWTSVEQFRVDDTNKDTPPHIVLIERVTDDPVVRFDDISRFFYRFPSPH